MHRREPNWHELQAVEEFRQWYTYRELLKNWIEIAGREMTADELLAHQRKTAHASTVLRTIAERLGLNQGSQSPSQPSQREPLTPEQEQARKVAAELNQQAIEHLRAIEQANRETVLNLPGGDPVPPLMFPDANGGSTNGTANAPAGLTVDPVDAANLDAGDEVEGEP